MNRAAFGHRLRVLALLGLGPGLVESAAVLVRSKALGYGLLVALLAAGLWTLLALVLGLPWAVAGLSSPDAGETSETRPGPVATLAALGLCAAPGAVAALTLAPRLAESVSPGNQPFVLFLVHLLLPALSAAATPAVAALFSRWTPGPLRRPGPRVLALAGGGFALSLAFSLVDLRFAPLGAALLGAALLSVGGPRLRSVAAGVALLAPVLVLGALAALAHAPPGALRGPATSALLIGAAQPLLAAASDDDGDGHGELFGGDDCDDQNAAINPDAREIARNGIDENCRGGDLKGDFRRPALPVAPPPASAAPRPASVAPSQPSAAPPASAAPPPPTAASQPRPHIILVVIDSLRADAAGPERGLTPNLDRLAAGGARFTRAHAASSATRFSVPALLTGRWMSQTDYVERPNDYRLDPKLSLLAEVLQAKGYKTQAIVPPLPHTQIVGLRRGFGAFDVITGEEGRRTKDHTTPGVVERTLTFLKGTGSQPAFVYVHLMDAHHPYQVTPGMPAGETGARARYLGEIARVDADLAVLFEGLEALRSQAPVLVAVTADHGESFMEHGTEFHAQDLYQTSLHVPLILHGPGIKPGTVIDTPVDLLDLGVTLAEAGGAALRGANGSSLRGLLAGRPAPAAPRPLFAELRVWKAPNPVFSAVIEWPHKLIHRLDTGDRWLYDLAIDPGEENDLWEAAPSADIRARLETLLATWSEYGHGPAGQLTDAPVARPPAPPSKRAPPAVPSAAASAASKPSKPSAAP